VLPRFFSGSIKTWDVVFLQLIKFNFKCCEEYIGDVSYKNIKVLWFRTILLEVAVLNPFSDTMASLCIQPEGRIQTGHNNSQ